VAAGVGRDFSLEQAEEGAQRGEGGADDEEGAFGDAKDVEVGDGVYFWWYD
jgi:hypothetical protein